jgi:hypothetical protein
MANELVISASGRYAKGTIDIPFGRGGRQVTVTGSSVVHNIQTVGFAAEEALVMGDVGTPGYIFIRNLDATNYVSMRPGTGDDDLVELKPGEFALFRLARDATAPFVQADTGACDIEYYLFED